MSILAWHWLSAERTLRYPPHTLVEVGQTLRAKGEIELCRNGLHASRRAIDALQYAPGAIVCRVELMGEIIEGNDKLCATERKCLWMADATRTLHEFAVWCAEQALLREREAGREPDARLWHAVEVKSKWIIGEATSAELDAARDAAWAAAGAAAKAAAWGAVGAAAWDAARDAAWAAAWVATRDAARDAAWAAARDAQNAELERRLMLLAPAGYEEATHGD